MLGMLISRRRPLRPTGYTLTDLIIFLVMLLLLGGILAPASHRMAEASARLKCSSNLHTIGVAMMMYASANNGAYPRTRWDPDNPIPTQFTNWTATNPFGPNGPARNDVSAAMFLLVRTQGLDTAVFTCPADIAQSWSYNGNSPNTSSNFPGPTYLSYSFQNCYPGPEAVKDKFAWTSPLKADFVVAADMNPGSQGVLTARPTFNQEVLNQANSYNHQRQGQNLLYGDLHVDWSSTCFAGVQQDNIYGAGRLNADGTIDPIAYQIVAPPAHHLDSVLLPTAMGKPIPPPPAMFSLDGGAYWFTYVSVAVFTGIIAAFVLALRKPRRSQVRI